MNLTVWTTTQVILFLNILWSISCLGQTQAQEEENFMLCPTSCSCTQMSITKFSTVTCKGLHLTSVPSNIPTFTKKLDLSQNNLSWIGSTTFSIFHQLQELNLNSNTISGIEEEAFAKLINLKELTLSRNQLRQIPNELLRYNSRIELLRLDYNWIRTLKRLKLNSVPKLYMLNLGHNFIEEIEEDAFEGLVSLKLLELNDNFLTVIPTALSKLPNLSELSLANNQIVKIEGSLKDLIPRIILLEIRGNPIEWIDSEGFIGLRRLKKLILSDVKNLTEFPQLNGTTSLEVLRIDRCSLTNIPRTLCTTSPKLKSLDLKSNRITQIPDLNECKELRILDLSSNAIEEVGDGTFEYLSDLHDLHLRSNRITGLSQEALVGLRNLRTLDMSYNIISYIHPEAFTPTEKLEDLNLGNNFFPELPAEGLSGLIHLKTFNNPNLREFPGPESFPRVRTLVLSYAYHCCPFNSVRYTLGPHPNSGLETSLQEDVIYPTDKDFDSALSTLNLSELWPGLANFSDHGELAEDFMKTFSGGGSLTTEMLPPDEPPSHHDIFSPRGRDQISRDIHCIPQPGPFMPCNDLFDWWTLRCGVWIVFLLALMGNGTVVFVLVFARTKMDVPRFLVCNLAIADFFMGIYLGFLAVVDAATLGEFRKYAIPWQWSTACQTAGFLGVLSSELSVYTLAVITMERHYAITHAMHLNKRLSLRHAAYIMVLGWTFSILMAVLPLFGISDYRKFAVCLPFETGDHWSLLYVVFLMFANGVAFTILMGCYLKMYCSIRGSQAWNSNDTRIAKRMALLVFTDLLCWFPIAFFSLTAVFGLQLVSLEEAKVFTVFILPFNSCCNPFLYAILTKQFKKDCVLICKAIEESRVTRGIGRCRNSSNFSNRQTAPNTGSLIEKSSKDGQQPCVCHNGLHPGRDMNGNAKYRFIPPAERWATRYGSLGRFVSRYILCQNNSKEANRQARDDYRMRNVRRYLYNTGNVTTFQPDQEKHERHASVSSDNFSSSRSDSWRAHQGRCGIPLRLLEPKRRNSWAVTRKPSQDSSLSNSRNDSSATSNSTATWRLSRSSVSSDAASHSGGGKSSLKKTLVPASGSCAITSTTTAIISNVTHIPPLLSPPVACSSGNGPPELSSTSSQLPATETKRPKTLQFVEEESIIPIPNVTSYRQHKRNSFPRTELCAKRTHKDLEKVFGSKPGPSSGISYKIQEHNHNKSSTHAQVPSATEDDDIVIDEDEGSAKIATNRPRLVRQSAFFSDEVIIEPEVCPVHGSLIPGTYDDENDDYFDEENQNEDISEEDEHDLKSPILRKYSPAEIVGRGILSSSPNSGNPYSSIALVVVPRRLSTIPSHDTESLQSRDGGGSGGGENSSVSSGRETQTPKIFESPSPVVHNLAPGKTIRSFSLTNMEQERQISATEKRESIDSSKEILKSSTKSIPGIEQNSETLT